MNKTQKGFWDQVRDEEFENLLKEKMDDPETIKKAWIESTKSRVFVGVDYGYNGDHSVRIEGYRDGDKFVVTKTEVFDGTKDNL